MATTAPPPPSARVSLASRADVAKLHQLLTTTSRRALRASLADAPDIERKAAEKALQTSVDAIMARLLQCTTFDGATADNDAAAAVAAAAAAGAWGGAFQADAELGGLEEAIESASVRVGELRATAPGIIGDRLAEEMRACAEADEAAVAADAAAAAAAGGNSGAADAATATAEAGPAADSDADEADDPPPPAELQARFAAAVARMPAVRARLEAAAERVERAVGALDAEEEEGRATGGLPGLPGSLTAMLPPTVARALRGEAAADAAAAAAAAGVTTPGGSHLAAEAAPPEETAADATRRRVAAGLRAGLPLGGRV